MALVLHEAIVPEEEEEDEEEEEGEEDLENNEEDEVSSDNGEEDVEAEESAVALAVKAANERAKKRRKKKSQIFLALRPKNTMEHDEYYIGTKENEQLAMDLIEYMKENWSLDTDYASSLIEIAYRTTDMTYHKRPANYWILKRARQKLQDHTGFFSNVRKPYECLGVPELDIAMLVFRNLPERLKISFNKWIENKLRLAEEKRKREAPLPRLPRTRARRPKFLKGRIRVGAGGTKTVDEFVRNAEEFQKEIRGPLTFTKRLERWRQEKDDEASNRNSPFGILRNATARNSDPGSNAQVDRVLAAGPPRLSTLGLGRGGSRRDAPNPEDRASQIDLEQMESMMEAIYEIFKMLLNMKQKQVQADDRLTKDALAMLRVHSPDSRRLRRKRKPPPTQEKQVQVETKIVNQVVEEEEEDEDESDPEDEDEQQQEQIDGDDKNDEIEGDFSSDKIKFRVAKKGEEIIAELEKKFLGDIESSDDPLKGKYKGTGRIVPKGFDVEAAEEIYPLSAPNSTPHMTEALDRVQMIFESAGYLDDRHEIIKIGDYKQYNRNHVETVEAARITKMEERFRQMFQRSEQKAPPIWHDVQSQIDEMAMRALVTTPPKPVASNAAELVRKKSLEFIANKGRHAGKQYTMKIPNPDGIVTPTLPGAVSVEAISADEQSRIALLSKCPGALKDEPPPTPIRRLYKEAGVKTTDKEMFLTVMNMKIPFKLAERKIRFFYNNEVDKIEWDTLKRYKAKVDAIEPNPIYERSIAKMRQAVYEAESDDDYDETKEKRPGIWYRNLMENCETIGGLRHHGCKRMLVKLHRYCDVDVKTRPMLLNRLCLLALSLSPVQIATAAFQQAIRFLLDRLFGVPKDLLLVWLKYRDLPAVY